MSIMKTTTTEAFDEDAVRHALIQQLISGSGTSRNSDTTVAESEQRRRHRSSKKAKRLDRKRVVTGVVSEEEDGEETLSKKHGKKKKQTEKTIKKKKKKTSKRDAAENVVAAAAKQVRQRTAPEIVEFVNPNIARGGRATAPRGAARARRNYLSSEISKVRRDISHDDSSVGIGSSGDSGSSDTESAHALEASMAAVVALSARSLEGKEKRAYERARLTKLGATMANQKVPLRILAGSRKKAKERMRAAREEARVTGMPVRTDLVMPAMVEKRRNESDSSSNSTKKGRGSWWTDTSKEGLIDRRIRNGVLHVKKAPKSSRRR